MVLIRMECDAINEKSPYKPRSAIKGIAVAVGIVLLAGLDSQAAAMSFTITKSTNNPVIGPHSGNGPSPAVAGLTYYYRDPVLRKIGNTWYLFCYGLNYGTVARTHYFTASNREGPYINQGNALFPEDGSGTINNYNTGVSDVQFVDGKWRAWVSVQPTNTNPGGVSPYHVSSDRIAIAYLVNDSANPDVFPTTGWYWHDPLLIIGETNGWTGATAAFYNRPGQDGIGGVTGPKVYPNPGGGYIAFIANWGYSANGGRILGYATAPDIDGPWTLSEDAIIGNDDAADGYQCEQACYFRYSGKHYLMVNRIKITGGYDNNAIDASQIAVDLWSSDHITGPYQIEQYDFIPKDQPYDNVTVGVPHLDGWDLDAGPLYGAYSADDAHGINLFVLEGAGTAVVQRMAYWKFDSADFTADSSGHGNNLSLTGGGVTGVSDSPAGVSGGSAYFNGSQSSFKTTASLNLSSCAEGLTIEWYMNSSQSDIAMLWEATPWWWNLNGSVACSLGEDTNNPQAVLAVQNTTSDSLIWYAKTIPGYSNEWHHYAVVYDRAYTDTGRRIKMYVDGQWVAGTVVDRGAPGGNYAFPNAQFSIGVHSVDGTYPFVGYLDEFRISRGVLTPDQFLYRASSAPKGTLIVIR